MLTVNNIVNEIPEAIVYAPRNNIVEIQTDNYSLRLDVRTWSGCSWSRWAGGHWVPVSDLNSVYAIREFLGL